MKVKKKKNHKFLTFIIFVSSVFLLTAFFSGRYFIEIYHKIQEKKHLINELRKLEEEENKLKLDASKLQDPDYIARNARENYLYSKDGEIIIQMPKE